MCENLVIVEADEREAVLQMLRRKKPLTLADLEVANVRYHQAPDTRGVDSLKTRNRLVLKVNEPPRPGSPVLTRI